MHWHVILDWRHNSRTLACAEIATLAAAPPYDISSEPKGSCMKTTNQVIELFLADHKINNPQRLDAAILLAESMMYELQVVYAQWRAAAHTLQVLKREAIAAAN
jgi:hypothetical protein